ncbi:hypothetical protein VPH166E361_0137 [Vibrio phage 166E36-1]
MYQDVSMTTHKRRGEIPEDKHGVILLFLIDNTIY